MKKFGSLSIIFVLFLTGCPKSDPIPEFKLDNKTVTIDENPRVGALVTTMQATGNTSGLTYLIVSQDPPKAFNIEANTGKITVADSTLFDYEVRKSLSFLVVAQKDKTNFKQAAVDVDLKDVDESKVGSGSVVTYTSHIKNILTTNCTKCHGGSTPRAGLDLTTYQNTKSNSAKINSRMNSSSNPMPPTGKLDQATLDLVAKWISDGLKE